VPRRNTSRHAGKPARCPVHGRCAAELVCCIVRQREVKEVDELAQIETAPAVSTRLQRCAAKMAAAGVPERAIVNAMTEVVAGASMRMAYPPICTPARVRCCTSCGTKTLCARVSCY